MPYTTIERSLLCERRLSGYSAGCSYHSPSQPNFANFREPHLPLSPPRKRQRCRREEVIVLSSGSVFPATLGERVRIVTRDSSKAKRILAEVQAQATVEQLWSVLTNYNQLASFVPNLEHCERLPGAPPGKQRILQQACSQSIFCRLQAEAVLDVEERILPLGRRELVFTMVSGDFKEFSGKWILEPDPSVRDGQSLATILKYEATIVPHWNLPSTLVAAVIRCGLPANVQAIVKRAEQMAEKRRGAPKFAKAAFQDSMVSIPYPFVHSGAEPDEILPGKGPPRPMPSWIEKAVQKASELKERAFDSKNGVAYLGLKSVPLPSPEFRDAPWQTVQASDGAGQQSGWRRLDEMRWKDSENAVLEVHLRRLDDSRSVKRRAVASVQINASREEVWAVLTDYEKLPEVVPGLVGCERLPPVAGAPKRLVRLRQVGFKNMMYMHLHAETTLALVESPCTEIQFKQINGDFQMLQGKFMLGSEPVPGMQSWNRGEVTELRYAVEVEIPNATRMVGLLEPLLEQVVYEDIPTNLRAIKLRVEKLKAEERAKAAGSQGAVARPTSNQMCNDFLLLAEELQRVFGDEACLPTRRTLREMKRYDLEVAIAHHGGMRIVGRRLGKGSEATEAVTEGVSLPSSLLEVEDRFKEFAREQGLPPFSLPSEELMNRCRRPDLLRLAKSWGGMQGLSELLGYSSAQDIPGAAEEEDFETDSQATNHNGSGKKPPRRKLLASFQVLAEELRATLGDDGPLPSSTELRSMKRSDLAAAVSHHGGAAVVSERMGWQKAFRGPNHWADLRVCREAVDEFCESNGLPVGVLPSVYSMQQAGRHDLPRAIRHWGGAPKFAAALGYEYHTSGSSAKTKPANENPGSRQPQSKKTPQKNKLREEIDSW